MTSGKGDREVGSAHEGSTHDRACSRRSFLKILGELGGSVTFLGVLGGTKASATEGVCGEQNPAPPPVTIEDGSCSPSGSATDGDCGKASHGDVVFSDAHCGQRKDNHWMDEDEACSLKVTILQAPDNSCHDRANDNMMPPEIYYPDHRCGVQHDPETVWPDGNAGYKALLEDPDALPQNAWIDPDEACGAYNPSGSPPPTLDTDAYCGKEPGTPVVYASDLACGKHVFLNQGYFSVDSNCGRQLYTESPAHDRDHSCGLETGPGVTDPDGSCGMQVTRSEIELNRTSGFPGPEDLFQDVDGPV